MSTTDAAAEAATASQPAGFGAQDAEMSDILETLGLPPEEGGTTEARTDAAVDKATRAGGVESDKDKPKVDAKAQTEEERVEADWQAVQKRVAERRKEREKARRAPTAAATAPAVTTDAKPAETAAGAAPLNAAEKEAASALRSIIAEIAKLAEEDAPAAGAAGTPAKDERAKLLKALEDKIGAIDAKIGDSAALKTQVQAAEAKLQEVENRRWVEQKIDATLDAMADKLPELSQRRNAVGLVYRVAEKYFEKHGKAPSLRAIAELVELKLTPETTTEGGSGSPEKTPAKGKEKAIPTRKTVSSSLATPPASTRSPDKRTKEEAERDFYSALGIDPEA